MRRPWKQRCTALAVVVLLSGSALNAQYFGQNKVRYENFDWQVLKTEHFNIYYYEREREAVEQVGRMAERWYSRLSRLLEHELPPNQPVVIYDSHTAFRGTTVIPGYIGETTGGVTEGLRRRVVLPLAGPMAETDHVLGHELVHAFQYDVTTPRDTRGLGMGIPGAVALPLWFIEGMAEYLSQGPVDPHTAMWIRDALAREKFPTIKQLDNPEYFPYRYGHAFWAYVAGRFGDEMVGRMLKTAGDARNYQAAIAQDLNMTVEKLSEDWRRALTERFEPVLRATAAPGSEGRVLVSEETKGGRIHTSPVLSPDGRRVIFFSEKDLFSIDMYLMNVETGKIERKLTDTAVDPHLDSLQFVNSAGAWSPDARRFAYAVIEKGKPAIAVYDVEKNGIVQRERLQDLAEVVGMTWAPDGRRLALGGIQNGFMDLFVLDLTTRQLERLTHDSFAELHPDWSPDGGTIAFVTDRFTSNPADNSYGEYRLALYRFAGGAVDPLPAFQTGKHTNPQWAGQDSLFFVSDHDGISNIYRLELGSRDVRQVTNIRTGVTGIAALSPAFSVGAGGERLVYSAFQDGGYDIYGIESDTALAGAPITRDWQGNLAGVLPPRGSATGEVASLLEMPRAGLPQAAAFQRSPYKPKLSLDYIAPPSIGMGFSSYGSAVGGGTALYWSDLLGHHNLMTAFQTSSATYGKFVNNLSAVVGYQNQKSRWNWGFVGGQMPYLTGGYNNGLAIVGGREAIVEQSINFWQINREALATFSYPFNRARRIEFTGGFRRIDFDAEIDSEAYDLQTGQLLARETSDLPTADAINMGTVSAALVHDTSVFGGTSPVMGSRYRFELGGAAGNITHANALADYRHYLRPLRWLTFAGRIMHYGRYGGDAEDPRFQDIYIGYPSLVRGYSAGSFRPEECGAAGSQNACPAFDQLFGSRLAVANVEMRIPILGALGIVPSRSVPPVETALFYDAGMAWYRDDDRTVFRGGRNPVTSYGVSLRVNLLGFAIGQISYVQPMDRPLKDWHWEFAFLPGF